jgi:hypothetical protein
MVLLPGRRRYVVLLGIGAAALAGLSLGGAKHAASGTTLSASGVRVWRVTSATAEAADASTR